MKKYIDDFIYGIYAGIAIGFGGLLNIVSKTYFGAAGKIVGSLLFPIGLTLVCFLSLNLFTGKIGYLFDKKGEKFPLFLLIIYLGNIVGSLILGFSMRAIFLSNAEILKTVESIGTIKTNIPDFMAGFKLLCGSVLCGALVYIAVFCYKSFENVILKIIGIFIPIAVFVYFGFDHCVANMSYFAFAMKYLNGFTYLNIALATLGNSLGAIAIDAFVNVIKKFKK